MKWLEDGNHSWRVSVAHLFNYAVVYLFIYLFPKKKEEIRRGLKHTNVQWQCTFSFKLSSFLIFSVHPSSVYVCSRIVCIAGWLGEMQLF